MRLAKPPPARLDIAPPPGALLPDAARAAYAGAIARFLQEREIPAEAQEGRAGDWQVVIRAELRGGMVVPAFALLDSKGEDKGHIEGKPVPAAAWSAADEVTLTDSAGDGASRIGSLIEAVRAAQMQSDPHSLYNRPAKIYLPPVTGAPGDGNATLTAQMRRALTNLGDVVQDSTDGADFTVVGHVDAIPEAGNQLRVEILWKMHDAAGHDLGLVAQLNEVPPETVSHYWGEVAMVVAQQAAGGVQQTVLRQSGHRKPEDGAVVPGAAAPKPDAGKP